MASLRDVTDVPVRRRRYDNRRRLQQARAGQRRVLAAARELLVTHGYAATTMTGIAEAADVSVESVYKAFGSKAALVKRVYDVTLAGDDAPVPIAERPEVAVVFDEPDPRRKLDHFAALKRLLLERLGPLEGVLFAAARTGDPDLQQFAAIAAAERLAGAEQLAHHLQAVGALRPGLDVDRARDLVWALDSPEVHTLLVVERGWTLDDYQAWLAQALGDALLP